MGKLEGGDGRRSHMMTDDLKIGELREWINSEREGTFLVIGIDGVRVDTILSGGRRDGFFKPYLVRNSRVISKAC